MKLRWFRRPTLAATVPLPKPVPWAILSLLLLASASVLALSWETPVLAKVGIAVGPLPPALDRDVVAGALAVVAVLPIRRFLYARLARRPGPVEISSFSGEPPKGCGVVGADLLAEFRRTLTEMSLSAPEPVPSEPSASSVVDDVRTAFDKDRSAFVTALLLIVSLLRVRHAYRVSVQVLSTTDDRCGMSIHVAGLPSGRGDVQTIWDDDWCGAAQRAAHVVGAYLVPRSRLSQRAPWSAWHGIEMPSELFHQSQLAARFIRERRYERALDALHLALKEDPQNPYLRIDLGQVQEQVGLNLDAAATYADIIAVESWFDGRLWRRLRRVLGDSTTGAPPARLNGKRNGRDALLIARYRVVTRLGAAEELHDQWTRPRPASRNGRRYADRVALKARLRIWLNSYARLYEQRHRWVTRLPMFAPTDDRIAAYEGYDDRLIHLIQFVGRYEAEALADDYRWSQARRVPGLAINQTAVQLLRLGAVLHERQARHVVGDDDEEGEWPISPIQLDLRIGRRLYLKPGIARSWKEYYNAACVAAIALRDHAGKVTETTILALQAVRHLERAVSSTDSGYVGRYAQWLSTGDQDLNSLRNTPQFLDFLDRYLPNPEPRVGRPQSQLVKLVMSLHTARLLMSYCDRRVEYWDDHLTVTPDVEHELALERSTTALVLEYVTQDRHWQTRMKLITEADEFCGRVGLVPVDDAFPQFQDDPQVLNLVDDPAKSAEAAADADTFFREKVIAPRAAALDALLAILGARVQLLRVRPPSPLESHAFWLRVARRVRQGMGLPEEKHRPKAGRPRRPDNPTAGPKTPTIE